MKSSRCYREPMHATRLGLAAALIWFTATVASAHHGKDFLIVESYDLPHPWDVYFVSSAAFANLDDDAAVELEPSLLIGVLPRLAFELHAHTAKEPNESFRYEATAPSLHFQVTPPDNTFPVRVGLSAEYEFAAHNAVHDRAEVRLILESGFGKHKAVANIIGAHENGKRSEAAYAAGYRYEFTDQFAGGIEGQGPITADGIHEAILGLYYEPTERITLKLGVGSVFDRDDVHLIARLGTVFRF
ncbi:MAG: hypothetical protein ABJB09_05285 [Verrucomicrobiota bacterium]